MKLKVKRFVLVVVGSMIVAVVGGFGLLIENEYCASCSFYCGRSTMMSIDTDVWHVKGYLRKFVQGESVRSLAIDYSKSHDGDFALVQRAFESCAADVGDVGEKMPMVLLEIRSSDKTLAKNAVLFCAQRFSAMLEERHRCVLDQHTARAKVQIEKAKRAGIPVPEEALREILSIQSVLEKDRYRVVGINLVKVESIGWRWRWSN